MYKRITKLFPFHSVWRARRNKQTNSPVGLCWRGRQTSSWCEFDCFHRSLWSLIRMFVYIFNKIFVFVSLKKSSTKEPNKVLAIISRSISRVEIQKSGKIIETESIHFLFFLNCVTVTLRTAKSVCFVSIAKISKAWKYARSFVCELNWTRKWSICHKIK